MSTPVAGNTPDPEPLGDVDPGARLPVSGPPATSGADDTAAVAVVPVEVTDAGWNGVVIEPAPTTADDIAALVLAVPDVVRLHAGRFGEVATYLPGRRVTGVKLGDDTVEVHVVVAARAPIRETARLIHAAVATLVATQVHVFVEDVA